MPAILRALAGCLFAALLTLKGGRRVDSLAFGFAGAGEREDGAVVVAVVVLGEERRGAGHEVCVGLGIPVIWAFWAFGVDDGAHDICWTRYIRAAQFLTCGLDRHDQF